MSSRFTRENQRRFPASASVTLTWLWFAVRAKDLAVPSHSSTCTAGGRADPAGVQCRLLRTLLRQRATGAGGGELAVGHARPGKGPSPGSSLRRFIEGRVLSRPLGHLWMAPTPSRVAVSSDAQSVAESSLTLQLVGRLVNSTKEFTQFICTDRKTQNTMGKQTSAGPGPELYGDDNKLPPHHDDKHRAPGTGPRHRVSH